MIWNVFTDMQEILTSANLFSIASGPLIFSTARVIFIILDVVLIFLVVYAFKHAKDFYPQFIPYKRIPFLKGKGMPEAKVSLIEEWATLETKIAGFLEGELPLAIIEADKLCDEALKRIGFSGGSMLERIQDLTRKMPRMKTLERFWRAHKARNHIAHTSGYVLSKREAMGHLAAYKAFLIELDCL